MNTPTTYLGRGVHPKVRQPSLELVLRERVVVVDIVPVKHLPHRLAPVSNVRGQPVQREVRTAHRILEPGLLREDLRQRHGRTVAVAAVVVRMRRLPLLVRLVLVGYRLIESLVHEATVLHAARAGRVGQLQADSTLMLVEVDLHGPQANFELVRRD